MSEVLKGHGIAVLGRRKKIPNSYFMYISFPPYYLFCFPGWGPQWLSYLWYLSDGRIRRRSLTWTHILHLGIFKRWA